MVEIAGCYIDEKVLNGIQKRVMIVGKFNRARTGGEPERYLFTNNPNIDAEYRSTFTASGSLDYEKFVTLLQPKISERVVDSGGKPNFPCVRQEIPANGEEDGTVVIDTFNYFFTRAVSRSEQEGFKDSDSAEAGLLDSSEADRGKEILKQIRKNLTAFCEFQPRNLELLGTAAYALHNCKGNGIPGSYNAGDELPKEFASAFIDFVYDENTTKSFEEYLPRIDFRTGHWQELYGDSGTKGRAAFVNVVNAVRDYLLEGDAKHYTATIMNAKSVEEHVGNAIDIAQGSNTKLVEEFASSRTAFNGLRQIVRSKVLLSMILEWLMKGFYELPAVVAESQPNKKARAIEAAIKEGDGVADAVRRPSKDERKNFSELLTKNFETILTAAAGRGENEESREKSKVAAKEKLPAELLKVVDQISNNSEMLVALQQVSGSNDGDTERYDAFVDGCKTILLDVLMPVLYRKPIMGSKELERAFRKESLAVYLTAIFLSDKNQNEFVKIAEDNLEYFESKINDGKIEDINNVQEVLLERVYKLLADPRIGKEVEQGMAVIGEIQALQEMAGDDASTSIADVVSTISDSDAGEVLEENTSTALIKKVVEERVKVIKTRSQEKASAHNTSTQSDGDAAGGDDTASTETSSTSDESGGNSAPARESTGDAAESKKSTDEPSEEDENGANEIMSKLEGQFDGGIDRIMDKLSSDKNVSKDKLSAEQVALAVQEDEEFQNFVGVLSDRVKAYEKTLDLIYRRYGENEEKEVFRNKVERMTLINMMLLWKKELGFGKVQSNLYRLLLDLILETNPESPDRMEFLNSKSMTEYFDNEDLANGGFSKLENVLHGQAFESLGNVVDFVSELRGVKYLMDIVGGDAEVIVVNADADEFIDWFKNDNVESASGSGRFRVSGISGDTKHPNYPALIYFTDIAFTDESQKAGWLKNLSSLKLKGDGDALTAIMPPLCITTRAQGSGDVTWEKEGEAFKSTIQDSLAPVVVLGPSPRLNRETDGFPTVVPAGYLLAVSVTGGAVGKLTIEPAVGLKSSGRFCTLCPGAEPISKSLENVIWGTRDSDYSLAIDLYLYLVLLTVARVEKDSQSPEDLTELWKTFCFPFGSPDANKKTFEESNNALGSLVFGRKTRRFALGQYIPNDELQSVLVGQNDDSISKQESSVREMNDHYGWFNRALSATR
jgi:hypothetical protein